MANEQFNGAIAVPAGGELATNKVLKNTYMLLAATLAFAGLGAFVAMQMGFGRLGPLPFLAGFFGLSFLVNKTANSGWGLVSVFLFTGYLGVSIGPVVNMYLGTANGGAMVTQAFGLTALTFFGLSAYVVTTRADMSFLRGFVMAGGMIMMGLVAIFVLSYYMGWQIPSYISLAFSGFVVLLMSGMMLWKTSEIVHGGETNYILATTTLFMTIYNMFMALLHIFGIMGDD